MPRQLTTFILVLLTLTFVLTGCRSTPEPVSEELSDEVIPETEAVVGVATLLPESTAAVAAFRPDELHSLIDSLPALDPMLEMVLGNTPFPPALNDALQSPAGLHLDSEQPIFLAVGLTGHQELLTALRSGAHNLDESQFSEYLHLRLIFASTNASTLTERLLEQCKARSSAKECEEFVSIESVDDWVTVNMALSHNGQWLSEVDGDLGRHTDGGLHHTTAWTALNAPGAAVALHTTFSALFDLNALLSTLPLTTAIQAAPSEDREQLMNRAISTISAGYLFEDPETAEFEDVTIRLENHDGVLTVDAIGSLTEYGQAVSSSIHRDATISTPSLAAPAVDIQWSFDLRAARESTHRPIWAQDTEGESTTDRLLSMRAQTPQAFLLFLARSPATTYALFDELFGEETTPSDFSRVQGLHMQLGLQPGTDRQDVIATMGLDLLGDDDLLPYEQFARAALLPFGIGADVRAIPHSSNTMLQTAIGLSTENAFTDELREIPTGVTATIDLSGVRGLYTALEGPSEPEIQIPSLATLGFFELVEFALPFTATIPQRYQQIRATATLHDDQSVMRIQFGGQEFLSPDH